MCSFCFFVACTLCCYMVNTEEQTESTRWVKNTHTQTARERTEEEVKTSCSCFMFVINALDAPPKKCITIDGKMNGFEHFNFHFKLCADNCAMCA